MIIKYIPISEAKLNEDNPRYIKEARFEKLVKSIKDFPQMLDIRPIVLNNDMIVLGGNQRLRACIEAGLKEIPVIIADNLNEARQREFIIKDNVGFGEWEWETLANEWDALELEDCGLEVAVTVPEAIEELEEKQKTSYTVSVKCDNEEAAFTLKDSLAKMGFEANVS